MTQASITTALTMKKQLEIMENLQELDLKIDALRRKRTDLPVALKALDDSCTKSRLSVEFKKNLIAEIEKIQKQTQAAVDLNQDRSTRASGKLEGVQNSQEFQAANKEIEQLKKLNASLEEQIKKAISDKEAANADLAALSALFDKAREARDAHQSIISEQEHQFDKDSAALMAQRKQYTSQIEVRVLAYYDRIRSGRAGVGIVPAVGGRCSGCNMIVPAQLYNEVQRANNMQSCPCCHRILFVPNTQKSDVAEAV